MSNYNLSVLTTRHDRTDYLFSPASHSQRGGSFDIHKLIGRLPTPKRGWTLPAHRFCGPYNPLESQLDDDGNPLPGQEPYNEVDAICLEHDKDYDKAKSKSDKHEADRKMLQSLSDLKPKSFRERVDKAVTRAVIGTKYKLGLGLTDAKRKTLDKIYYDASTGYSSIDELQRRSGFNKKDVLDYLQHQETYTKHRPANTRFPKRKVITHSPHHQWQADLCDMRSLSKYNDNVNYILTVIDVFSRYAYALPIRNKTGDHVTEAFAELFKKETPQLLQTDKGTEFINKKTQALLKTHNVKWFTTENLTKAQMVERFNRTLKDRMYKYFTANKTKRWIDVLQDLVHNYNTSYHRTIKMTPEEALQDPYQVQENTQEPEQARSPKFKPGDYVRISKHRKTFKRGYEANFTDEVFIVLEAHKTDPPTYEIVDIRANKIIGTFYEDELSLFKPTTVQQII